jgi:hypothetical protein
VQGILKDESAEQFIWALTAVKKICQDHCPQSIFTDADPAAELALNKLFPTSSKYRYTQLGMAAHTNSNAGAMQLCSFLYAHGICYSICDM